MAKNNSSQSKHRWLWGIGYFLGGILILLIIAQVLVSLFADDYAANYLKEQVNSSSDSPYTLDFDDLDLNVFSGSATISNLRISADTSAFSDSLSSNKKPPKTLFSGTVGEVDVGGVNVISGVWGNELHIGSITITEPDISALKNPQKVPKDSSGQFASIDSSIYARISNRYKALEIGEFNIRDAHGLFSQSGDTLASVGQLNLNLQNIRVDSASARSGRTFVTDDISLNLNHFMINLADSVNKVKVDNVDISSADQRIAMDSLELIPRYPRFEYSRKNGLRKDRIDLLVPDLELSAVDFTAYADSGRFYAQYGEINDVRFEDFLNKAADGGPQKSKTMKFVAFRTLDQPIKIDSLKVNNAFISYSEYAGNTPKSGTVTFEQLNGIFRNISNYPDDIEKGLTTTFDARAQVMGSGPLDVHFDFPMDTKEGFHKINGTLGSMAMTDFNPILEHVAFVRVDRGMLNSLEFEMTLDDNRSNGTLIMKYENLKISVLNKESLKQKGLKENIFTFLANNVMIKKNNVPGEDMQAGPIRFERDRTKSMFNYWWKSLLSGIKESVK